MSEAPIPARRPSRLPTWTLAAGGGLLALSFISGVIIWWAQLVNGRFDGVENTRLVETRPWVLLHGALNPLLCGFLGYLSCLHIPLGWQMKANRLTGSLMLGVFAGLVFSGMALAYFGEAWVRSALVWTHRVLGLALPLVLALHWYTALRWAKKV
jgi:hypothetical protein